MTERRRSPRRERRLSAVQHLGNQRVPRTVRNLGPGGFFVEQPGLGSRQGDLMVMEFGEGESALRVTGEVTYVSDDGVGVRITRADWERLTRLLEE